MKERIKIITGTEIMLSNNKKAIIKQDANFLEYPLWRIDRRDNRAQFEIETKDGKGKYIYRAKEGMIPDDIDMGYLYYFLLMAQKTGKRKNQHITHTEVVELHEQENRESQFAL